MKSNILLNTFAAIAIAAFCTASNRASGQVATITTITATQTSTQLTGLEMYNKILAQQNAVPLALYPPGYFDWLLSLGNNPMPLVAASSATNRFGRFAPRGAVHLKPGNKARMKWVDAQFLMGSPATEAERNSDEGQYTAIISYGFYIGNFEVTQSEYNQVMGDNPSYFTSANGYTDDLNRPVENVTWEEANYYCYLLTQQALADGSISPGWEYRLPTEAEWEYSCRAKTAQEVATASKLPSQPPYPVPWLNPADGIVYHHYWIGTSQSGYSSSGYIYYFNDSAPTVDENGNDTTVGANVGAYGIGIGTKIKNNNMESAWSNPTSSSQGVEFGCSDVTSGLGVCSVSGVGDVEEHWAWCPNVYFGSDLPVYSSLGHGVLYIPGSSLPAYTAFSFGNGIYGGQANFNDEYEYSSYEGTIDVGTPTVPYLGMTADVGSYLPNHFGLSDMHGNVAEWCQDWYGPYPTTATVDPHGPSSGTLKVVRGGSWADHGVSLRSAARLGVDPSTASSHIGFRIVLAPVTPEWETSVQTQPSIKTYGVPPTKEQGKDGLVLITHGWIPKTVIDPISYVSWVDTMSNDVIEYLTGKGVTDWQVCGYKWDQNAQTYLPGEALNNATQEGISLGTSIASQGWTKVHFIAHSAGSELIQTAMEVVKALAPNTVIQCTFLDPYSGYDLANQSIYGIGADWSDRYASHGDIVNDFAATDEPLDGAYNVDVTDLDIDWVKEVLFVATLGASCEYHQASHGWAIGFYENTITGNVTPDYAGFGFPLSMEGGGWPSAPEQYPVGNVTSVKVLGTAPLICGSLGIVGPVTVDHVNFSQDPVAAKSTTGTVIQNAGTVTLITGSPVWLSIVPTNTTPVDLVSFDADFESGYPNAAGLLSVLWDTNVIGTIDERVIGEGAYAYALRFPVTESNSVHVLSFRLDPFTNVSSTVVISNVVLSAVGVTQLFSLSVTTNTVNGATVFQLTGEAGYDYGLQATSDLARTNWTQIATLENTNGTVLFYDPDATNHTQRFYRAVAPY